MQWNRTEAAYPAERCIHELFEAQVSRTPEAIALIYEQQQLSYAQLNAQANRLARHLIDQGVGPDTRVALCVERGVHMVVGLLAVLKAGGAYVPLDPTYPAQRLAFMLEDSAPQVLLLDAAGREALGSLTQSVPCIDLLEQHSLWAQYSAADIPRDERALQSTHLAYVIYTSGSTGTPKGVMVEHRKRTVNL